MLRDEYNFNNKEDRKEYFKQYYLKNKERLRDRYKKYGLRNKERIQKYYKSKIKKYKGKLNSLYKMLGGECYICNEVDRDILEFHHLYGKTFEVSRGYSKTFKELKDEAAKCILLCCNCHCRVTKKLIVI